MVSLSSIFKWRRSKKFVAKPPPAAMQARFNDRQKLVNGLLWGEVISWGFLWLSSYSCAMQL